MVNKILLDIYGVEYEVTPKQVSIVRPDEDLDKDPEKESDTIKWSYRFQGDLGDLVETCAQYWGGFFYALGTERVGRIADPIHKHTYDWAEEHGLEDLTNVELVIKKKTLQVRTLDKVLIYNLETGKQLKTRKLAQNK